MADKSIYVQFRGRTLGPVSMERAIELRDGGQLMPDTPVSWDNENWLKAADIRYLFAPMTDNASASSDNSLFGAIEFTLDGNPPPDQPCHLMIDGEQLGPFELDLLRRKYIAGRLHPDALIWYDGMTDWQFVGSMFSEHPPTKLSYKHSGDFGAADDSAPDNSESKKISSVAIGLSIAAATIFSSVCLLVAFTVYLSYTRYAKKPSSFQSSEEEYVITTDF
jgi:hypothetical protein